MIAMEDPLSKDIVNLIESRIGAWLRQVASEWKRELIAYGCTTITLSKRDNYKCSLGFAIFRGEIKPFLSKPGYLVYAIRGRGNTIGLSLVMLISGQVSLRVYDCGTSMCYAYSLSDEKEHVFKYLSSMVQQLRKRRLIRSMPGHKSVIMKLTPHVINSLVEIISITEQGKCPCEAVWHA